MKNYRNTDEITKEEMLQNLDEMTELLGQIPDTRNDTMLRRSLAKHSATTWGNPEMYQNIVKVFVRRYADKLYEDLGMAAGEERVYAAMGVATRRASYNDKVLEVI